MSSSERGATREIALEAWRDMRRRPLMWLLLSASSLPLVFLFYFLIPGTPSAFFLLFLLVGYGVCFTLYFLFWCMAVFLYDGRLRGKGEFSYGDAYARMGSWAWPSSWAGLVCGLITVMAFMAAQIVVSLVLSFLVAGQVSTGSLLVLTLVHFYLSYLVADLAVVLIVLVPQMLALERGRKVEEVIRASYRLIRERYKDALILFIIPEIVMRTLFLGASFAIYYVPGAYLIFTLLLLCMAFLEGARTAFVAASFNRFYYRVLEEEEKKRKAKPKKQAAKKQPAKKQGKKKR